MSGLSEYLATIDPRRFAKFEKAGSSMEPPAFFVDRSP